MSSLAIFASGSGSNFISIFHQISIGEIKAKVCLFITDNSNAKALEFAKSKNIPSYVLDVNMKKYSQKVLELLENNKINLIVLAGYLKLVPKIIVDKFENKIINIHPALLPSFGGKGYYGLKVHKEVIDSGVKKTGVTIHYVNSNYDQGQIIVQKTINVLPEDTHITLAKKVLNIEHQLYPFVLKAICEDRIDWINGKPWIIAAN